MPGGAIGLKPYGRCVCVCDCDCAAGEEKRSRPGEERGTCSCGDVPSPGGSVRFAFGVSSCVGWVTSDAKWCERVGKGCVGWVRSCLSGLLERVRTAAGGGEDDMMGSSGYIVRADVEEGSVGTGREFAAAIDRRAGNTGTKINSAASQGRAEPCSERASESHSQEA